MYLEAVGLATSTYKEGFERGEEIIFIDIHSFTSEPSLIDIFTFIFAYSYSSISFLLDLLYNLFSHQIDLLLPRKSSVLDTHPAQRRSFD